MAGARGVGMGRGGDDGNGNPSHGEKREDPKKGKR
jgi:hypothetical protein